MFLQTNAVRIERSYWESMSKDENERMYISPHPEFYVDIVYESFKE